MKRYIRFGICMILAVLMVSSMITPLGAFADAEGAYLYAKELYEEGRLAEAAIFFNMSGDFRDAQSLCDAVWDEIAQRDTFATGYCTLAISEYGALHTAGRSRLGLTLLTKSLSTKGSVLYPVAVSCDMELAAVLLSDGTVLAEGTDEKLVEEINNWKDVVSISVSNNIALGLVKDGTVLVAAKEELIPAVRYVSEWRNIKAVSAGEDFALGIRLDGTVVSCSDYRSYPIEQVEKWTDIKVISAGEVILGIKNDGTLVATEDMFGEENTKGEKFIGISSKGGNYLALKEDGTLLAGGYGVFGENEVDGWTNIVAVTGNENRTIALTDRGNLWAIGEGFCLNEDLREYTDVVKVSQGLAHTAILRKDGTVRATGNNTQMLTVFIRDWSGITDISSGYYHTVGLRDDGTVVAVGNNNSWQCNVSKWKDIVAIDAGPSYTVGLRKDGTVVKSGAVNRELGWNDIVSIAACGNCVVGVKSDGTVVMDGTGRISQEYLEGWSNIKAVAGSGEIFAGLKNDGRVCMVRFDNESGTVKEVDPRWDDIVSISVGYDYVLGLKKDGTVVYYGSNEYDEGRVLGLKDIVSVNAHLIYGYPEFSKRSLFVTADGDIIERGAVVSTFPSEVHSWTDVKINRMN